MNESILYLLANTRAVVRAQQALVQASISCRIIPVPRHISTECGMSLEIAAQSEPHADMVLKQAGIGFTKAINGPD